VFKGKLPRVLALVGSLTIAASLISVAVAGTGAYFTASAGGEINGNLATVAVTTSGGTGSNSLDFVWGNMLPGVDSVANINVQNTGTVPEDIYLAFDNTNGVWSALNTLGAYGIFSVNSLVYNNMNNQYAEGTDSSGQIISTDSTSGCYNVPRPNHIEYLPHVIFLGTLGPTASLPVAMAFHFHACMTAGGGNVFGPLVYKIAAFQQGVDPNDSYNGLGRIAPLNLSGTYHFQ
jgi:hypothetical protein